MTQDASLLGHGLLCLETQDHGGWVLSTHVSPRGEGVWETGMERAMHA